MERLSLAEALASGRLDAFVLQAEAEGIGNAVAPAFDLGLGELIKERPPEGQTSRLRARGSSRGK